MNMRFLLILLCMTALTCCQKQEAEIPEENENIEEPVNEKVLLGWTIGTRKVFREDKYPPLLSTYLNRSEVIKISAASNEYEPFQIVAKGISGNIKNIEVEVSDLVSSAGRIRKKEIQLFVPHHVNIESHNPSCPSGFYPDALIPIEKNPFTIEEKKISSVWVLVHIPKKTVAGIYKGPVRLKHNGKILKEFTIELNVWDFSLPDKNSQETSFGMYLPRIAYAHGYGFYGFDPNSPEFLRTAWNYYWYLIEHRLTPREIPSPCFSKKWYEAIQNEKVSTFWLPWGWDDPDYHNEEYIKKVRALPPELLKKGYVYALDELPHDEYYKAVQLAKKVHESYGREARVVFTMNRIGNLEEVIGSIDIWCPVIDGWSYVNSFDRQAKGETVWWYTAMYPLSPFPTYLIDDYAIAPRVFSWLQVRYKVEGTLYWSTTYYCDWNGNGFNVWNAPEGWGDGLLIYPGFKYGIDGPIGSIRLEMIREGNEDLEYFALYREKLKAAGVSEKEIHERIVELLEPVVWGGFANWTKDPDILMRQRERLAKTIQGYW